MRIHMLAVCLTVGLLSSTPHSDSAGPKSARCGSHVTSSVRHLLEVKDKDASDWRILEILTWKHEAETRAAQLQMKKRYAAVRIRALSRSARLWANNKGMNRNPAKTAESTADALQAASIVGSFSPGIGLPPIGSIVPAGSAVRNASVARP